MMRILFVDDEPKVLRGLERTLCDLEDEWETAFAGGGEEALDMLAGQPFDVIVSDMRMPGMNGAQLLDHVRQQYPDIVRIVLSGHSDKDLILQSLGSTHQYLAKPCELERLHDVVTRARTLRELLTGDNLRLLVSRTQALPSQPRLYVQVMEEIQSPRGSIKKVAELISQDIGMTAKILQIINSAFFGLPREVSDPSQAVALLGLDTVRALILAAHVFHELDQARLDHAHLGDLWKHSLAVGAKAKQIASAEKCDAQSCDHALIAGLLHDTGKLILAVSLPDHYRRMLDLLEKNSVTPLEAERRTFGSSHAEIGAYLFGLWGLPDPVVEAVAFHHLPDKCVARGLTPLTAVHVADALAHEECAAPGHEAFAGVDMAYLDRMGLTDRLPGWRESNRIRTPEGAAS